MSDFSKLMGGHILGESVCGDGTRGLDIRCRDGEWRTVWAGMRPFSGEAFLQVGPCEVGNVAEMSGEIRDLMSERVYALVLRFWFINSDYANNCLLRLDPDGTWGMTLYHDDLERYDNQGVEWRNLPSLFESMTGRGFAASIGDLMFGLT